ncbi:MULTISPECIES: Crp/Fnr family transcriptional regulator [Actinomadura]|uniref:Crp/Fnr family transcriptional regulator n=1 Tax=Actinomadura TaxID=1988 RepID=UPI00047B9972|nr:MULTISPECIES: Crp/Fnr family transcriptional regulator [Actinomadura]RSN51367.1 Crp/Fnr family transcriptional regulator [Actinomadura sp. WAC 06369]
MSEQRYKVGDPLLIEAEHDALKLSGQLIQRPAGTVFMNEGEQTDFVMLIEKGVVKIKVGQPARTVALRRAGEIVGEMAPIRGTPRSATVEAATDVSVLWISAAQWLDFLDAHPRAAIALIAATDERLDQATQKIKDSEFSVERRLAGALLDLVEAGIGRRLDDGVEVAISQQELASLAGARIDSIKKVLRIFKDHGLIRTGRQRLTLVELDRLSAIATGSMTAP